MDDKVDASVKDERIERLLRLQDEISYKNNEAYVGRTLTVLVDSMSKRKDMNTVNARTYSNKLVHLAADNTEIGKYINVKIERAGVYELYATKIDK
jgi:tRNA-2-methylthio-N6-dimethylallyladenosine synthase